MKIKRFGPYKSSPGQHWNKMAEDKSMSIKVASKMVATNLRFHYVETTSSNKARVDYEKQQVRSYRVDSEVDHKNNKGRAG
jgi:hypothetical protein